MSSNRLRSKRAASGQVKARLENEASQDGDVKHG
jgi:hypothetical protein